MAYLEAAIKNAGIELPEVTSEDNGKALQVVNGAWAAGYVDADDTVYSEGVSVKDKIDSVITDSAITVTSGNVTDLAITGQHFVRNGVAYIYGGIRVNANISDQYICDLSVGVSGDVNWVGVNRTTHQVIAGYIAQNKLYCNEGTLSNNDLFIINVSFKVAN